MELPRFRSQSLPQEATISPELAAAGAGAMSQALASGLDVVASVTARINEAEEQARADRHLARVNGAVTALLADPELQAPVVATDARVGPGQQGPEATVLRPTSEVVGERWDALQKQVKADSPRLKSRAARLRFEQGREQILTGASTELADRQRKLAIEAARIHGMNAAQDFMNQGLYGQASRVYDDLYNYGVLTATEADKAQRQLVQTGLVESVRTDILLDPKQAAAALLGNDYPDLEPEQRIRWLEQALKASESEDRRRIAAEDRAIRLHERAEKRAGQTMAKEGDALLAAGDLSEDWIEANRELLSPGDYRYFYRQLTGADGGTTNLLLYADLRERAGQGEDVIEEARDALTGGRLKREDYDRVVALTEQRNIGQRQPDWARRGGDFIKDALRPSDLNYEGTQAIVYANANSDWLDWVEKNPEAGPAEGLAYAKRLVNEYQLADASKLTVTLRKPRFATDRPTSLPALEAAEIATIEALERGAISESEFDEQSQLFRQWRRALPTTPPEAPPRGR